MANPAQSLSMKKAIVWSVILISAVSLLLSISVTTYLDIQKQRQNVIDQLHTFGQIMAFNATTAILFDDADTEQNRLSSFKAAEFIDNIHIYRVDDFTNETEFFASYNKVNTPPVPVKYKQINQMLKPYFTTSHVELIHPIEFSDKVIGYVYVRASLQNLNNYVQEKLVFDLGFAIFVLTMATLLALKMQRKFVQPIESIAETAQTVAKNKDYTLRVATPNIKELSLLTNSFNTMLERIQQHIGKQETAEQEIRLLNQSLEEKVFNRTQALKESNQELLGTLEKIHQYQNQLVENEKMASLGQMVAGVAHEVNTPIGLGVTASTLMLDKLADIKVAFDDKKLTSSQLAKFISEGEENLQLIYRNLNRAAELISSFKQVAVDQSSESTRRFNLHVLINEVLLSLKPNLKKFEHQVHINCADELNLNSKPGPINQILINLIINSLTHAFPHTNQGNMFITAFVRDGYCHLEYRDDGCGVDDSIKNKVFDPFVTTKRGSGGSGLGLHLVYNLVTQALGGTINLKTEAGKGVHFTIQFPLEQ